MRCMCMCLVTKSYMQFQSYQRVAYDRLLHVETESFNVNEGVFYLFNSDDRLSDKLMMIAFV